MNGIFDNYDRKHIRKKYSNLSDNSRIVVINVMGAFLVKGLSLIVSFLTLPAYINFFNGEIVLGVWFTILSVISWILNFDLGVSNGLRNHLTIAYIEKDYQKTKQLVSSAYAIIGIICLVIIPASIFVFDYVDWNFIFHIEESVVASESLLLAVKIIFIGIVLQLFFKIVSSVLYAIQKSSINNALSLTTAIIILLVVMFAPARDNNYNLIFMSVIYDVAALFPYLIASLALFSNQKYNFLMPCVSMVSRKCAILVFSLGGYFFFIQILYMLIMSTNEYYISLLTSNADVVAYKIYFQIFTLVSTAFFLALTPIWSVITKAITEKKYEWIDQLYRKLIKAAFIGTIAEFMLIVLLQPVFDIWLGERTIQVSYLNAFMFAILGSLIIFNAILSSVANGMGRLRTQLVVFLSGAILKIPLAIILVEITESWIGVVMATDIILLVYCIVQPITIKGYLKRIKSNM